MSKPCISPEMILRFSTCKNENKNIRSADSTVLFLFLNSESLPSLPLALVTMIRCMSIWVTAWPQPAFSTHWQKWRVNCGRHCKGGGWLWVRTISRFNLAPAHSYCTYFHRCKVHQIGFPTQKTVSHILIANMINVLVTIVPWTRCDFSVQPRSNKKMSKCLHTFASDMGKKARERIFGCSPRTYIANPLCVWARTRLSTQHSSSSIIQKVSVNGNTRD